MKWYVGLGGLVCIVVLTGCSARKVHERQISIDRDSVVHLSAEYASLEGTDRSIQVEWWGDAVDHPAVVPIDSIVSDSASSGRGGIRIRVDERMWTRSGEKTANDVRMRQTRYEDDFVSPNMTRWRWMWWMIVFATIVLLVWYGLKSIK